MDPRPNGEIPARRFISGTWGEPRSIGPFTATEVEELYLELIEADFYSEQYCADWNDEPYRLMANIIIDALQLAPGERVIDIGCGAGFLVTHLTRRQVDAWGYEFSEQMADRAARNSGQRASRIYSVDQVDLDGVRLAVSMEVFEHLPLSLIEQYLSHLRAAEVPLFLTIPSSGVNAYTGVASFTETDPQRLHDLERGTFFRWITVDEDPRVGGGHITLAGYSWWENLFMLRGYVRSAGKERRLTAYNDIWQAYRWCPFVLEPMVTDAIHAGPGVRSDAVVTLLEPSAEFRFMASSPDRQSVDLEISAPSLNYRAADYASAVLLAIDERDDYVISERIVASSVVPVSAGRSLVTLPLDSGCSAYRLVIHTPSRSEIIDSWFRLDRASLSNTAPGAR